MLAKLNELTEGHGPLRPASALVTGVATLGFLCFLGVLDDYVPNGFFKQLKFPFVWKS